jgi:translation initiation factor 1
MVSIWPDTIIIKHLPYFVLKSLMIDDKSRLVYSTDKVVSLNNNPSVKSLKEPAHASQQRVYVRLERKGRGGKSVTLIESLQISAKDREALLRQLKTRLGTGGSLKNDLLEIQGDQRDAVMALLQEMGYKPKRSGG